MHNPLLHPEQINPRIAADVQAAFEKNREAGRVVDSGFAGDVASAGLADIVRADTAEAKEAGILVDSGLERVTNPEIKRNFEDVFANTEKLFSRINLEIIKPEEFTIAGVDFVRLEKEFERMTSEGLEPQLVVAPALPLIKDISPNADKDWYNLYDRLTSDSAIIDNPLKKQNDGNGLWVSEDVCASARDLLLQEVKLATDKPNIHHTYLKSTDVAVPWTVALLSTTDKPQGLRTSHPDYEAADDPGGSKLATISQYLTLQATRIQSGQSPLDKDTSAWLQGTFNDGAQAPYGYWNSGGGRVVVDWDDVGDQDVRLGVRLPVWG